MSKAPEPDRVHDAWSMGSYTPMVRKPEEIYSTVYVPTCMVSETDFNPNGNKINWVIDLMGVDPVVKPAIKLNLNCADAEQWIGAYPTPHLAVFYLLGPIRDVRRLVRYFEGNKNYDIRMLLV